jgi:hypothetical protein
MNIEFKRGTQQSQHAVKAFSDLSSTGAQSALYLHLTSPLLACEFSKCLYQF